MFNVLHIVDVWPNITNLEIKRLLTPFITIKEYVMKEEVYTKTVTKVKLCKAANLSYPTVRCWMEKGLLTPKRNENNDYYVFNALDIMSIHNIIYSKNFDLTLSETKSISKLSQENFLRLLEKKQDQVSKKINELQNRLDHIRSYYNTTLKVYDAVDGRFYVVKPSFKYLVETDIFIDEHINLLAREPCPATILFDGENMSDETSSFCIAMLTPPKKGKILVTIDENDRYLFKLVKLSNRDYNEELLQSARKFAAENNYGKVENMIYSPKLHHLEKGKDVFIVAVYFKLSGFATPLDTDLTL